MFIFTSIAANAVEIDIGNTPIRQVEAIDKLIANFEKNNPV